MPKPKNTGSGGRMSVKSAADCGNVTVYDYAHVKGQANVSERARKAQRNPHHLATQEFAVCQSDALEELDWDERDLESFDTEIDSIISKENEVSEANNTRIAQKKKKYSYCTGTGSQNYPLDLWFLVARFISPEDVGRFAGICQATHLVTHTAHFWVQMYHRIHSAHRCDLPTDLQPYAVERVHGLRARVVRSIHHVYPPFLPKACNFTQFSDTLCKLEGTRCISSWYVKKTRRLWHLFFKFKRIETQCVLAKYTDEAKSFEGYQLLRGFSNLHDNQHEGCYILQVVASAYTSSLQTAMGLYLVSIGVSVSRCMRHHKLKLVMDSRPYVTTRHDNNAESKVVCIDPAMSAKVFAWWQRDFPQNA